MNKTPIVVLVLVHGAFADGSGFAMVIEDPLAEGYRSWPQPSRIHPRFTASCTRVLRPWPRSETCEA